ncbi:hypothetical protein BDW74DRAFT_159496 [Aspergillus multicolor]|uniref:Leucine Rich Repeat domain protein n=1 Tax=Aspergillus multicolor TaxID=41759 RepID=UPI003CCDEA35
MGSRGEAALLQRQGQNLYGQGNWDGAISAFTEALKCPDVDALSVLDNRAATYTKLVRYDQALKDARHMIKRDKQDERGYMRCAKALLLDGKPEKALEVYAYALKTLPKDNPRRQVLEQMHTKLHEKLVSKCYDPFSVFPLEIARMVLDHFDFRQIVAILRVSKGWDRFLSSLRDLFMRIDFTGARSKIHWSSVLAYIRRSKAMLTHAIVINITKASIHRSLEYISRCPNLQHLEILSPSSPEAIQNLFKGSKNLRMLLVSSQTTIPQATLTKLLSTLPRLERIEIHSASKSRVTDTTWPPSLPKLQSITLGTTESGVVENFVPALYIPRLIDPSTPLSISNLAELRLHSDPQIFVPYPPSFNPADFPHLKKLDISGLYIGGSFGLPSSLEFLRIRGGAALEALPFATVDETSEDPQTQPLDLPNLTTLIFSDVPWVTHLTLQAFVIEAKVPLDVLHVDSCFRITAASLFPILRAGSHLHTLNVSHIMGIEDSTVAVFVDALKTLKVLNLSFTEITGVTIKALVDTQTADDKSSVECVYVKGCERVSSDAIEYGRSHGLVVVT